MTFTDQARAKINLTLHVGKKGALSTEHSYAESRAKMHPLNSLVVFADIGDELSAVVAEKYSLAIDGPFAHQLEANDDNLVMKAVNIGSLANNVSKKLSYKLSKNLPVSSGIGGGSADSAAALRLLGRVNCDVATDMKPILVKIGADVPVCYLSKTCIMEGVGETLTQLPNLGQLFAILVNPSVGVSTKEVFEVFDAQYDVNELTSLAQLRSGESLLEMAKAGRNDLQKAAMSIVPIIQTVLDEINIQSGCQLARMSGSGATCFGIFTTQFEAQAAAKIVQKTHPDWWCIATLLGDKE